MNFKFYLYLPLFVVLILAAILYHPTASKTVIGYGLILVSALTAGFFLIKDYFKTHWPLFVQLILMISGALMLFLFLTNSVLRFIFILITAAIFSYFILNIYQLFYRPRISRPHILKNSAAWLNFFIAYCFLVGLSAYLSQNPLGLKLYLAAITILFLLFWLNFYFFWINSQDLSKDTMIFLGVISLVLGEIYLAINFLPLAFYLNALIISILFSIIINLWVKKNKESSLLTK
ncbi:MAG: hypothetical protein PHG83_00855 [Patescibacteria group bacterium]|nr:hypothetical protein [Patescibacteria group bacterium]